MEGCRFCAIARKEIAALSVYEDDLVIAFLDIHPVRPGHTLIIPRGHFPFFEDLPDLVANRTIQLGQRLSHAMKKLYGVPRVGFLFAGFDVAHTHAHVIPMRDKTDITSRLSIAEETLTFRNPPRAPSDELAKIAAELGQILTQ
jgi:histidine triad (HIT) family protein